MNALQIHSTARELGRKGLPSANPFPAGTAKADLWDRAYKRGQQEGEDKH